MSPRVRRFTARTAGVIAVVFAALQIGCACSRCCDECESKHSGARAGGPEVSVAAASVLGAPGADAVTP